MNQEQHTSSRLFTGAGGLMVLSGVLMAVSGRLALAGIYWAAASCMFFAAYHFRLVENKKIEEEKNDHGKEAL